MFENTELIFYRQIYLNLKKFKKLKRQAKPIGGATLLSCAVDLSGSLYHFREHFQSVRRYSRADIESRCTAYALIGDVANAIKHANLTSSTPHGAAYIKSASDVQEIDVVIGFMDDQGPYWHTEKCISVKHSLHPNLILDNFVIEVYNFWRCELESAGLHRFPAFRRFSPIGNHLVPRSKARLGGAEIMQGLPFRTQAQILLFDPERNLAVPFTVASNLEEFSKSFVEIRIKFSDESEPITIGKYDPPDDGTLETLLAKAKGADINQLTVVLLEYGIDLWGLVRDQFGVSANGRSAAFELQKMRSINIPRGLVSITRNPLK